MTTIRKNPFELVHVGNTVQVWIGVPNEPESELVLQCSTLLVDQLIATLRSVG
jgi:hypothetical protein